MTSRVENRKKNKDIVLKELNNLFSTVLPTEIIKSVALGSNFDIQRATEHLLEMSSNIDSTSLSQKKRNKAKVTPNPSPIKKHNHQPSPIRNHQQDLPSTRNSNINNNNNRMHPSASSNAIGNKSKRVEKIEQAIENIRNGYKVLIMLRGAPGCGKSYLAKCLADLTLGPGNHEYHIFSTDDFFMQRGQYVYEPSRLQEYHQANQNKAFNAISKGFSPVIIDNTNTQMWHMRAYAAMATDFGYIIEILEPDTWWFFNEHELAKRNKHNVPKAKIKEILEGYEKNITPVKLLSAYSLAYKFQKPPQFRVQPPITRIVNGATNKVNFSCEAPPPTVLPKSKSASALNRQSASDSQTSDNDKVTEIINLMDFTEVSESNSTPTTNNKSYKESDSPWDNNPVDDILMYRYDNSADNILQPNNVENRINFFDGDIENAWGIDEKALQSWKIVTPIADKAVSCDSSSNADKVETNVKIETKDEGTSFNFKDFTHLNGNEAAPEGVKIVTTQERDINSGCKPEFTTKPPKKLTVDKSCLTDDVMIESDDRNDSSKIDDLRDLFPRIPRSYLKEIYEKCSKDFNWTVDLLLEDSNKQIDNDLSLDELSSEDPQDFEEAKDQVSTTSTTEDGAGVNRGSPPLLSRDTTRFKHKPVSEESVELKKLLESKIDISETHYSTHVRKVKQFKFGGSGQDPQPSTSSSDQVMELSDSDNETVDYCDYNLDDPKNLVELNLGDGFVAQLEQKFGQISIPQGYQPVVQLPVNLARQLYSFYIESVCQQMEAQSQILEQLEREDEEFARKLQAAEEATSVGGDISDAPTPNLTEIMTDQAAASSQRREAERSWQNLDADNWAAKMTREKLFKVFPTVDENTLLEILHAYNNDYNNTVEVLISSVGEEYVNGDRYNIKEPPITQATIQEMKEAEADCQHSVVEKDRQPALYYRDAADVHLKKREDLYSKAHVYYQRGMTEVAMFYSQLAKKETALYDIANGHAATAFLEEHSERLQKFDTLDLHFLYIKEAIPALDVFIDRNINLLRGGRHSSQELYIITGRGNRSEGGVSKLKPAVMTRLRKRKINFVSMNPGLLKIKVHTVSMMSNELSTS